MTKVSPETAFINEIDELYPSTYGTGDPLDLPTDIAPQSPAFDAAMAALCEQDGPIRHKAVAAHTRDYGFSRNILPSPAAEAKQRAAQLFTILTPVYSMDTEPPTIATFTPSSFGIIYPEDAADRIVVNELQQSIRGSERTIGHQALDGYWGKPFADYGAAQIAKRVAWQDPSDWRSFDRFDPEYMEFTGKVPVTPEAAQTKFADAAEVLSRVEKETVQAVDAAMEKSTGDERLGSLFGVMPGILQVGMADLQRIIGAPGHTGRAIYEEWLEDIATAPTAEALPANVTQRDIAVDNLTRFIRYFGVEFSDAMLPQQYAKSHPM
jgi:hypothetical protein